MTATTFARIQNGAVAELIVLPDDLAPADAFVAEIASTLVDLTGISPMPEVGWTYDGKAFAAPVADLSAAWTAYKAGAQAALDRSDKTLLRCIESSVAVPAAWADYRKTLRGIVGAKAAPTDWTVESGLPASPAYPSGT